MFNGIEVSAQDDDNAAGREALRPFAKALKDCDLPNLRVRARKKK